MHYLTDSGCLNDETKALPLVDTHCTCMHVLHSILFVTFAIVFYLLWSIACAVPEKTLVTCFDVDNRFTIKLNRF